MSFQKNIGRNGRIWTYSPYYTLFELTNIKKTYKIHKIHNLR
jgi:hypothetical protein